MQERAFSSNARVGPLFPCRGRLLVPTQAQSLGTDAGEPLNFDVVFSAEQRDAQTFLRKGFWEGQERRLYGYDF
ncbi:MAG TPA: hypothetical protein DEV98_05155 [Clostridiales bacterium]|nr:hypothetical protein [Clostridiales bacterium]